MNIRSSRGKKLLILGLFVVSAGSLTARAADQPGLQLLLSVDQPAVAPGQSMTYTITVTNTGTEAIEHLRVVPVLSGQFVYADGATPKYLENLETLPAGGKLQRQVLVRVPTQTPFGRYEFAATARAANVAPVQRVVGVEVGAGAKTGQVLGAQDTALDNSGLYLYLSLGLAICGGLFLWRVWRARKKPPTV